MSVLWLAAYPKSGVTWLQFLLTNYIYGEVKNSKEVLRWIPDIHRCMLNTQKVTAAEETMICKTHLCYGEQHPYAENTAGFVYLLRHPKDILMSNLNYFLLAGETEFDKREFALEFIRHMGVLRWSEMGFGSWGEHISSWMMQASKKPHLFMHYEELHESPCSCLENIIRLLGLEVDDEKIRRCVEASSFQSMKKM